MTTGGALLSTALSDEAAAHLHVRAPMGPAPAPGCAHGGRANRRHQVKGRPPLLQRNSRLEVGSGDTPGRRPSPGHIAPRWNSRGQAEGASGGGGQSGGALCVRKGRIGAHQGGGRQNQKEKPKPSHPEASGSKTHGRRGFRSFPMNRQDKGRTSSHGRARNSL